MRPFLSKLAGGFFRNRQYGPFDEEVEGHLRLLTERFVRRGMSAEDAHYEALRQFGGITKVKETHRENLSFVPLEVLWQDSRHALRLLRRSPLFAFITVFTLALGISASTMVFSLIDGILWRSLPYQDASELVRIWSTMPKNGIPRSGVSFKDYTAFRESNHSFSELAADYQTSYDLTNAGEPERLQGAAVSPNLFSLLRVSPLLGRPFSIDSEQWGKHRLALVSDRLWHRRFGGDRGILGQVLTLNAEPYTVVGVMPSSILFPSPEIDLWTPLSFAPNDEGRRSNHFLDVVGRLRVGISIQQAETDLALLAHQLGVQYPENTGIGAIIEGLQQSEVGDIATVLEFVAGVVALVLMIVCANIAGLLVARSITRRRELAVRVALGASRSRLLRQFITESVLLACFGGGFGLLLAFGGIRLLHIFAPPWIPRLNEVGINIAALAVTLGITLLTGFVFGIFPALQIFHFNLNETLRASSRSMTGGITRNIARRLITVVEVMLSFVLLIGAGLLVTSFIRLQQVNPGFNPSHLLTMRIDLPASRYSYRQPERIVNFIRQIIERSETVPGVKGTGVTTALPLSTGDWAKYFSIQGRSAPTTLAQVPNVFYRQTSAAYLRMMRAKLISGRFFQQTDRAGQPGVAIINRVLAQRYWPTGNPVGQIIFLGAPEPLLPGLPKGFRFPRLTIVGVVDSFHQNGLDTPANPEVFVPLEQAGEDTNNSFFLALRVAGAPLTLVRAVKSVVNSVDPEQAVWDVRTMEDRLQDSLARRQFTMIVLSLFASVAVLLAAVGIYGVISQFVSQRSQEIGIRMALGAKKTSIIGLVLREAFGFATAGMILGVGLAFALARLMRALVYDVSVYNPMLYVSTAVGLLSVVLLACYWPARRAANINPVAALRVE